ncbi:MAG: EthD domain-containing protein [bacterium]
MIKFTECIRRSPSLSHEEFLNYWLNVHGPLVKSLAADLKMGRYVQSHTLVHPVHDAIRKNRGTGEPYDGIVEVRFESREAMERSFVTPAMKGANKKLREDENHFIDWAASSAFFTEEHVIIE